MLSVIIDDSNDPARNLALDEALLRCASPEGHAPPPVAADAPDGAGAPDGSTLRVWQSVPTVLVGRFQDITETVDLAACARDGIRVVRRMTGGGAVFTDPGSLNVTLVQPAQAPGPRPDLDTLMAVAAETMGLPPAALRDGAVQTAGVRTRHATLAHATVHVASLGVPGDAYVPSACGETGRRTLAHHRCGVIPDIVRTALLGAAVHLFGTARARYPSACERRHRDHLLATRYNDVTWQLSGASAPGARLGFLGG